MSLREREVGAGTDGRSARRFLTLGWMGLGGSLVSAAIEVIRGGWAPLIDNALIAAMTVDSVSLDPPLVGMPTSLGLEGGTPLSHPGPLGFWLLALPTKVVGEPGSGLVIGSLLVSLAVLAGIAAILRSRDDLALEAVGLALLAAMVVSIGPANLSSPFNTHLGILPLVLCLLGTWGVLSGRSWHALGVIAGGSIAAQVHVGYVPLVAAMVVLTAVGLGLDVVRARGTSNDVVVRRVVPAALAVGVLAWIGPILDQLFGAGNLVNLLRNQQRGSSPVGFGHGFSVAVDMTALPPRWLSDRAVDMPIPEPGWGRFGTSILVLATMAAFVVLGLRRRDRHLASLGVVALTGVVGAFLTASRLVAPETDSPYTDVTQAVLYRLYWWPVGTVVSLAFVWGALRAVQILRGDDATWPRVPSFAAPSLLAVLAVGVFVGTVATREEPPDLSEYATREQTNAAAIASLPGAPDTIVLRFAPEGAPPPERQELDVWSLGPDGRYGYAVNLVAQLRLRGIAVRFAAEPDDGVTFFRAYRDAHRARGDEPVELLYLVGPSALEPPPEGYRVVSRSGAGPGDPPGLLTTPAAVLLRDAASD